MISTIMVVDDSVSVRKMLTFTLENAGYSVVEAENGRDALEKLEGSSINLFFVDLNMPGVDGFELIRSIRSIDGYRSTPVIMLTTESQESKKRDAQNVGATGWITKPFNPDELVSVVRNLISINITENRQE